MLLAFQFMYKFHRFRKGKTQNFDKHQLENCVSFFTYFVYRNQYRKDEKNTSIFYLKSVF